VFQTIHLQHFGGLAQLVERLHGMQKVSGSTPLISTPMFIMVSAFFAETIYFLSLLACFTGGKKVFTSNNFFTCLLL
jgi:hypothetical protein